MASNGGTELLDASWWDDPAEQQRLFEPPPVSTPLVLCEPTEISVQQVSVRRLVDLQRAMSRVNWRPSPGRNLAFTVTHGDHLLGIGFLSSPVFALSARDEYLDLPRDPKQRGAALRHYADLSVCVGAQPFAWHWNAGKLIASLSTTLGDWWLAAYGDELLGLTTTSVWGKGSQYNRLWKFLGYTQGYGNCHIPDHVYRRMVDWMDSNGVERLSRTQSSVRMRNAVRFRRAVNGQTSLADYHGQKRAIYYAPAVPSEQRLEVVEHWFKRWGHPRFLRTKDQQPPYRSGIEVHSGL